MKESHREGPASHPDPESCVGSRKATGEALTGVRADRPLSCEINRFGAPTPLTEAEGNIGQGDTGEPCQGPAQSKTPRMHGNSLHGNREIPCPARDDGKAGNWKRAESPWPRVRRDLKSGEGDPRYRAGPGPGTTEGDEPRRLGRNEQIRLVEALKIALARCHDQGVDGGIWRSMLYEADLGVEPKDLDRMSNLLKATVGYDPREAGAHSTSVGQREHRRSAGGQSAAPTLARAGKVNDHTPATHGHGKSDARIVPRKPPNKEGASAEAVEGRRATKGNTVGTTACRTQSRGSATSGLDRVREVARRDRRARFTALLHHVTPDLLEESFYALRRGAAPGVDGVTWKQYGVGLGDRILDLHRRVHSGTYRARPSKRAYIPKADGRQRPLGIAALEDKIVQQAVVTVLNRIYEEDFLGFSYGFRPGRSQHDGLDALWVGITGKKVSWVLDVDIRGFFDAIDHGWLQKFLEHRIADRRVLRLVRKWLRAGVSEEGKWSRSEVGTPQGAVASPLLANVYLHYALDLWVHRWRTRYARGDVIIVRYADDFVMGFQHRHEAEQFRRELKERLEKFGLALHPEKTRLIEFGRFAAENRQRRGERKPESFDFLGFTHYCGRRRSGGFLVRRKTMAKRLCARLQAVKAELMRRRHDEICDQGRWLRAVVQGYFNYHAIPGNWAAIKAFRTQAARLWRRALRRRSQRHRLDWKRFRPIVERWLPRPRILHPYPNMRFFAKHPR